MRVVVPKIWSGGLSAAFISIAVVLGEYTVASLAGFQTTLPVGIVQIGQTSGTVSLAASLARLLFYFLLLSILAVRTRRRRHGVKGAGFEDPAVMATLTTPQLQGGA